MDQMRQRHVHYNSEGIHFMGTNVCTMITPSGNVILLDHHHILDAHDIHFGHHFLPCPPAPLRPRRHSNSYNNGGHAHAFAWHPSLPMPYVQAPSAAGGSSSENVGIGLETYHYTMFPHLPPHYHSFHDQIQPVQEIRDHSYMDFRSPVTAPSYRVPTNHSFISSTVIPNALRHAPFAGASIHRLHGGNMHVTTLRHPPVEFFLDEGVALLVDYHPDMHLDVEDISDEDDADLLVDHHPDMHLDIEDMSYEELNALGEQVGNVNAGLSEEMITTQMKTKTYLLPTNANGLEEAMTSLEEQGIDTCIICQDEYKNQENIGILKCGHEYHADCLRKWLLEKNVCPLCRSEALTPGDNCA